MKVALAAMARNEQHAIAEWIGFHAQVGFDAFIVYDNGSTDGTIEELQRASREVDVRVVAWDCAGSDYQTAAYDDVVRGSRAEFDWVALLDCDEFLDPRDAGDVKTLLSRFEDAEALALNWAVFGSSGFADPPGGLMTESFLHRACDGAGANTWVRSVVRPRSYVRAATVHMADVRGRYVNAAGEPLQWLLPGRAAFPRGEGLARVNHYFVKSRAEWREKIARGYRDGLVRTMEEFDLYDRNEIDDDHAAAIGRRAREKFAFINRSAPGELPLVTSILPAGWTAEAYLKLNPDVASAGVDPTDHFVRCGSREGRRWRE